jgi:predicted nucleic acid-binding protein
VARSTDNVETLSADIEAANAFLRRLDLPLRTSDALHIAICQRADASLATFDAKMKASAINLGTPVTEV